MDERALRDLLDTDDDGNVVITGRFEGCEATDRPTLLPPGTVWGYDQLAADQCGLMIGDPGGTAMVVVGTPEQLREWVAAAQAVLDRELGA